MDPGAGGRAVSVGARVRRLVGVAGLAGLVWLASVGRADAQLGALFSPGKLAKAHAGLEGISNCQKCHEQGNRVTAAKCLTCHAPVAERITRRVGVHKDVKADCVSCHAEHGGVEGELRPFDSSRFDHAAVTGFPLSGKHGVVAAKCDACHKARSFLTLTSSCASCHTDVHKGTLGKDCASCHSTQTAFKELSGKFDHARARFPLLGAHQTVACASCHVNNVFKGIKFASCTSCHQDPHVQKFGTSCTTCHTNDSWRTRRIDHAKTAFPLVARHATVDCAACHRQRAMTVKPKADTCAACHADVHRGNFKQDCKACHSEAGWNNTPFDHSQTKFALTGKHEALACVKCHTAVSVSARLAANRVADFRGLKTTCVGCHADVHGAELGAACESCHSSTTFRLASFTHARFPEFFAGQHAPLACDKCHVPAAPTRPARTGATILAVRFKTATTACASCHQDVHFGQVGTTCETCHTVLIAKFSTPGFSHNTKTSYALTGRHETTLCASCHKMETGAFPAGSGTARRFKGVATACSACHMDVHLGQLASACETCHATASFRLSQYQHRNVKALPGLFEGSHLRAACAACHKPSTGRFPKGNGTAIRFVVDSKCVSCHTDIHRGSLGPNCGMCHRP